jgi:hypothetical protein
MTNAARTDLTLDVRRDPSAQFALDDAQLLSGPAPEHATYGSFAISSDPDGNGPDRYAAT